MNKLIKLTFYIALIGLTGIAAVTIATRGANARDDLKKLLAGASSKEWQLKQIKTADRVLKAEDFDDDEDFDMKSDLAQLVPDTIVFHADGTCENTYVSQYDDNGAVSDDDYSADCKWSVKGTDVEIIEDADGDEGIDRDQDEIIVLEKVTVTGNSFKSGYSLDHVYSGGVKQLSYKNE